MAYNTEVVGHSGFATSSQARGHHFISSGERKQVLHRIHEGPRRDLSSTAFGTGSVSPNEEALDNYVASTQGYPSPPSQKERSHTSGAYFRYSDDTTRESSGSEDISREIDYVPQLQMHSALLRTLKPQRFEMPNHDSYHGELNGKEAEGRLSMVSRSLGSNCYLTRYSETQESYVVSAIVYHQGIPSAVHIKLNIDTDNNSYSLEGTEKTFRTLDELLNYFEQNPLSHDIRELGMPCLPPDKSQQRTLPRYTNGGNSDQVTKVLQMNERLLDELSKQREDHKKEVEIYREELEKEKKISREIIIAKIKEESKNQDATNDNEKQEVQNKEKKIDIQEAPKDAKDAPEEAKDAPEEAKDAPKEAKDARKATKDAPKEKGCTIL